MVVEEAVASGIEEIILVVAPGRTLVLDHFAPAPTWNAIWRSAAKTIFCRGPLDQPR